MQPNNEEVIKVELPKDEEYKEKRLTILSATIIALLATFIIGNLSCLALFFLNGFGITSLSDVALCALAAATIAEVAGLLTITIKCMLA